MHAAYEKAEVLPILVSVDEMDGTKALEATYDLPFAVLSDPDLKAHEAFHVVNAVDDAMAKKLAGFGISLDAWSQRKHHKIAIPSQFLIGKDKKILWAHAARDHKTRPSSEQVLKIIEKL